jgi:flagellar motor switch protein FliN/FliY
MDEPSQSPLDLSAVMDIPLTLRIVIGSVIQSAQAAMRLGPGSVLTLAPDSRGELSIFTGPKLVARGQIVLVEGRPAIRITAVEPDLQRN